MVPGASPVLATTSFCFIPLSLMASLNLSANLLICVTSTTIIKGKTEEKKENKREKHEKSLDGVENTGYSWKRENHVSQERRKDGREDKV